MDQLGQIPSRISILSLLLRSEAHGIALMKVLNTAHVMQDITVGQFDDVITNIMASRCLGFNDAELTVGRATHNRALYIFVTSMDTLFSNVLVDTGSSLNVMPKNILSQILVEGAKMRVNALVVRAFDGSRT